jgi:HSP20 family protein
MKFIRYQTSPLYNRTTTFTSLPSEIDRLFDAAFSERPSDFPVDLYQEKDTYVVRAELPGFRKEDLTVEVANGVLTVTGQQKTGTTPEQKKEDAVATQERRVSRSVTLPENIKADTIKARYENGVLTVTLPKPEEVKSRQITIDVK